MRAVDTNLLVRLVVRDDPTQVAAAELFVQSGAWISHVVLVETTERSGGICPGGSPRSLGLCSPIRRSIASRQYWKPWDC